MRTLYSSVDDRSYRWILSFFAIYTAILVFVPVIRLVPRVPVPILSFVLCFLLYRWRKLPGVIKPWLFYLVLVLSYWQLQFVVTSHFQEFYGAGIIAFEKNLFG
ncbi:MAG: hypothetical protein KAT47_07045, partial [Candidatus Aegiribacteria sp.]|nr:hypothetical protein [Candidatus Aegiribacteria sp.]